MGQCIYIKSAFTCSLDVHYFIPNVPADKCVFRGLKVFTIFSFLDVSLPL